jgi:hypothetical protein
MLTILSMTFILWAAFILSVRWLPRLPGLPLVFAALAAIAALNAAYYLHLWDASIWYYRYRTATFSDFVPALSGFYVGCCLWRRTGWSWLVWRTVVTCIAVLVPWAKPLLDPLEYPAIDNVVVDGAISQQSSSTCGPCALAFTLAQFGVLVSEGTLAREAFTSGSGTELWYLARCAERRGFTVSYRIDQRILGKDSIIGISLAGTGHFISVIAVDGERVSIHDSMKGRRVLTAMQRRDSFGYQGMYLKIGRPPVGRLPMRLGRPDRTADPSCRASISGELDDVDPMLVGDLAVVIEEMLVGAEGRALDELAEAGQVHRLRERLVTRAPAGAVDLRRRLPRGGIGAGEEQRQQVRGYGRRILQGTLLVDAREHGGAAV